MLSSSLNDYVNAIKDDITARPRSLSVQCPVLPLPAFIEYCPWSRIRSGGIRMNIMLDTVFTNSAEIHEKINKNISFLNKVFLQI